MIRHHAKPINQPCPFLCGKIFKNKLTLSQHMNSKQCLKNKKYPFLDASMLLMNDVPDVDDATWKVTKISWVIAIKILLYWRIHQMFLPISKSQRCEIQIYEFCYDFFFSWHTDKTLFLINKKFSTVQIHGKN